MNQGDSELKKIQEKKLAAMLKEQANLEFQQDAKGRCVNCKGTVEEDLQTELKPEKIFCPNCVIMCAKAFVLSKAFMIEFGHNKKRQFAKVREYNQETHQLGDQKIIDLDKFPVVSCVGTVDFFKAVPAARPQPKITIRRKGDEKQIDT